MNVNELLGFEVGDLETGKKLASVKVLGWNKGPVRRHGNPRTCLRNNQNASKN
jgi:hypothetical protein